MKKMHPFPAIPVIAQDPFFSLWDMGPTPYSQEFKHWTGAEKILQGFINIDGMSRRLFGRAVSQPMPLQKVNVTPMSTEYVYEGLGVHLTVRFTSPLLTDDLDVLSTPITYVDFHVEVLDGKEHIIKLHVNADQQLVCGGSWHPECWIKSFRDGELTFGYMGQKHQKPLCGSGDHVTADWGYLWFCSADTAVMDDRPGADDPRLHWSCELTSSGRVSLMIGYDDTVSINYFGRFLHAYYARNGKTIVEAFKEFHERHDELTERCKQLDAQLIADAYALGGQDYVNIVTASYRQSLAGHKLVQDYNGDLLFISKENDSNACAATVDVAYAGIAMYLYYSPELVRAMMRPAMKFAKMPVWEFDFAPHDVGRYPVCTGQVYSSANRPHNGQGVNMLPLYLYPAGANAYALHKQFPVEESGNVLLLLAGAARGDGDYSLCAQELPLLEKWCRYLIENGEDPGEQLCTDDFTGHLAHNANLAAKAFMGVAAFADILDGLGKAEEAAEYRAKAQAMANSWLERCFDGEKSGLTLDGAGWSIKYNLVWDKLFGWNLLPDSFYEKELSSYVPKINTYGLPLDGRAPYTKPEWSMSVAAMMLSQHQDEGFQAMIAAMARFLNETEDHVPFCDLYDTVTGLHERFYARTVVGGTFMPLLMKKWQG